MEIDIEKKIYGVLDDVIKTVIIDDELKGLILDGESSLGKTFRIRKILEENGKKENVDYVFHSGHTSPMHVYMEVYENRDKIFIFDDESVLENRINLNLLKAMLRGGIVKFSSKSLPAETPKSFVFTGKIFILTNKIPMRDEHMVAVENRVFNYTLKLTRNEIIDMIFKIAEMEVDGVSRDERIMIAQWIKDNSELIENLNFSLFMKAIRIYINNKDNWKSVVKTQLKTYSEEMRLIIQDNSTCEDWMKKTGLSRATYFRKKQKIKSHYDTQIETGIITIDSVDKSLNERQKSQSLTNSVVETNNLSFKHQNGVDDGE